MTEFEWPHGALTRDEYLKAPKVYMAFPKEPNWRGVSGGVFGPMPPAKDAHPNWFNTLSPSYMFDNYFHALAYSLKVKADVAKAS